MDDDTSWRQAQEEQELREQLEALEDIHWWEQFGARHGETARPQTENRRIKKLLNVASDDAALS